MDRWLAAVEKDHADGRSRRRSPATSPTDLHRPLLRRQRLQVSDGLCQCAWCTSYGTPRTVAGDAITTDTNKCQLKPLNRATTTAAIPFTDDQWAQLQTIFPNGVCDFSKPGVAQQRNVPWLTYQDAHGQVIYGGRPMPPAPRSVPTTIRARGGSAGARAHRRGRAAG